MNTDPHAIRARVDAILADLAVVDLETFGDGGADSATMTIETAGHRLEEAHQILVDALESVEKG